MRRKLITLKNGKTCEVTNPFEIRRVYRLYRYLKENAVSEKHKKSAMQIILALNEDYKTRQVVEKDVQTIRMSFPRKLGSNVNGYWLMTRKHDETDGYAYIKHQALSKMKIALLSGIDENVFFQAIQEYKKKSEKVADGQVVIDGINERPTIVRRYSDDLIKD